MEKIAIVYGSTTGNTQSVAEEIAKKIGEENVELIDVSSASEETFNSYSNFILGSSTWGIGDIQDDWYDMVDSLAGFDLENKKVAIFGLGDGYSYSDSFVDAIGTLYEAVTKATATVIGSVSTDGYSFGESLAVKDGEFVGLPIDEDNESQMTEERISNWLENILPQFN